MQREEKPPFDEHSVGAGGGGGYSKAAEVSRTSLPRVQCKAARTSKPSDQASRSRTDAHALFSESDPKCRSPGKSSASPEGP